MTITVTTPTTPTLPDGVKQIRKCSKCGSTSWKPREYADGTWYECLGCGAEVMSVFNVDEHEQPDQAADAVRTVPVRAVPDDPVNHPAHYTMGGIEVIDAIEAWGLDRIYNLACVVKYVARCDHKEDRLRDMKKARWYLNREIERTETQG